MSLIPIAVSFALAAAVRGPVATRSAPPDAPVARKLPVDPGQKQERTSFQTGSAWEPKIQLRSDVVMCYGIGPDIAQRIAGWKAQGYIPELMTGVAWGEYQDYLYGRFDGVNHVDEAQTDRNGHVIGHGGDVYYMSPGENYGKFLCVGVKRAIDAGAQAIYLEEPEFWVRGGYSKGFQREWRLHYGEDWIAPHTSPDAQYRASELKYFLYRRALKQVFDYVKELNLQTGKHIKCYVPTHSLINYASWNIVSPESSLLDVGADGYIAQVWTGTARTPNMYEGRLRERTFETAFLEYGVMMNLVRASKSTVWFLNDPIEDNPNHTWTDYKMNWESTLTASLLWPRVSRYEVAPWPERIFHGKYPSGNGSERVPIPPAYATELLTVFNALNDMRQTRQTWDCGTRGIGVVVSDSMMFQRGDPQGSDQHLGSFYGLAMPLVKRGIPVEPVQLETSTIYGALTPYKVLLMTYEGMKPMKPDVHDAIVAWVKAGGTLIFVGDDADPYNHVRAWWNTGAMKYASPREHLFEMLGVRKNGEGTYRYGAGTVIYNASSPAALTYRADGADLIRKLTREACVAAKLPYVETDHIVLRRGPYVVGSRMTETPGESRELRLRGKFIDLFQPEAPVRSEVTLKPGDRCLLLDLTRVRGDGPFPLASACKILGAEGNDNGGCHFHAEGPDGTNAVVWLRAPNPPKSFTIDGGAVSAAALYWDADSHSLRISFPNSATGHEVVLTF